MNKKLIAALALVNLAFAVGTTAYFYQRQTADQANREMLINLYGTDDVNKIYEREMVLEGVPVRPGEGEDEAFERLKREGIKMPEFGIAETVGATL